MKSANIVRLMLLLLFLASFASPVMAQTIEIHPYAGGFFPDQFDLGKLKSEGLYGVKGGYFLTRNVEVEGNVGYINHFKLQSTEGKTRAWIWEGLGAYNVRLLDRILPYVSAGIGGVTAQNTSRPVPGVGPAISIEGGDTFFAFSYGGGIKANRLGGPVGLRADVRGRTLPNFFGGSTTLLELTGGINLTWGEQ